jgi:hypothetical protein
MIAETAHVLHFTLADFDDMTMAELERWHAEAAAIVKALTGSR